MPCLVDILGRPALFLKENVGGADEGERRSGGGTGRRGGKGTWGQDVIYERTKKKNPDQGE